MSAKSVWGVVLIVLGVIAVISALQDYAKIDQLDQIAREFASALRVKNPMQGQYDHAMQQAKVQLFAKILIGIGLCFGGTWMIQDSHSPKEKKHKLPPLPKSPHDWKFMSDEEVDEFIRPTEPVKPVVVPIYSDPKRPEISKARCGKCEKEFTYPTKRVGDMVPCPQCRVEVELP